MPLTEENMSGKMLGALITLSMLTLTPASIATAGFIVTSIGGSDDPTSIQATVTQFGIDLGDPNNMNNPGPLPGGRREINWDGGGNNFVTAVSPTPFAGFQLTRGALFVGASGTSSFVQAPLAGLANDTFSFFSPFRIFAPLGGTFTDALFSVPGSTDPATISGFGAVFTDVDILGSSRIEFFGINDNLLFSQDVPVGTVPDGSLSFLGAIADAGESIFRVRLISGNTQLGLSENPAGGSDVVAMDDFLFAEPRKVPEPGTLLLMGAGLAGIAAWGRKRGKASETQ
jgi:hypothetical protein